MEIKAIGHIRTPYGEKFGIPRQSNLVRSLEACVVLEPEYRDAQALRGIEDFEYIWLIWEFSAHAGSGWSPTVRPPRLGGNRRMGVFATRSPFRPNALGLSSVRLKRVEWQTAEGPVLHVSGADLMDGTPIYDIKPYLPYTDAHADARSGFASEAPEARLQVECAEELMATVTPELRLALRETLAQDPRPRYHDDATREYGMHFFSYEVKFKVHDDNVLEIVNIFNTEKTQRKREDV